MQLVLIQIFFLYTFLFFQVTTDSIEIVEVIMDRNPDSCLIEDKWKVNPTNTPSKTIELYKNWVFKRPENSLLTRNFRDFLSEDDIDSMKVKYRDKEWLEGTWESTRVHSVKNLTDCKAQRVFRVTEPLFNITEDKALIYVQSERSRSSSFEIVGLKKVSEEWIYVGRIPRGIGHKK